jgi:hypothetical protein
LPRLIGNDAVPRLSDIAIHSQQPALRKRAVTELGSLAAEECIAPLTRCLLLDPEQEVREMAATALSAFPPAPVAVAALLEVGAENGIQAGGIDRRQIATALRRTIDEGFPDGSTPASQLLKAAVSGNRRWPYLAALLVTVCGDSDSAGRLVNAFEAEHGLDPEALRWLRIELGGPTALDPILDQLRDDLHTYFQMPVHALNEQTRKHWEQVLSDARTGFRVRMAMSVVVFAVGVTLLLISSWRFLFGDLDATSAWGAGVSFAGGISSMLLVVYSGPLRDIRQSVRDLGASNAIFIAYVHRVLQASHVFTALYLRERMTFEEASSAAALIKQAMQESIDALDRLSEKDGA